MPPAPAATPRAVGRDGDERERAQPEIDQKDAGDDLGNGEAVVGRALIEVRAVRLPERLALGDAAGERDGRVGEIIEREDERRRQMAVARKLQQQPAEQKTDRQASHVAQKEPRDRLVERSKAQGRAQQRGRDQRGQRSDRAEPPSAPGSTPVPPSAAASERQTVRVSTDVLDVDIDPLGATLVRAELTQHRATVDTKKNFVLLERSPEHTYIAESGLIGEGLPNHKSRFTSTAKEFRLADGQDRLEVPFESQGRTGYGRGRCWFSSAAAILFASSTSSVTKAQERTRRTATINWCVMETLPRAIPRCCRLTPVSSSINQKDKFQKVAFEDIAKGKTPYSKTADDGWIGIVQHYFVAAWIPPEKVPREFYTKRLDRQSLCGRRDRSAGEDRARKIGVAIGKPVSRPPGSGQARRPLQKAWTSPSITAG